MKYSLAIFKKFFYIHQTVISSENKENFAGNKYFLFLASNFSRMQNNLKTRVAKTEFTSRLFLTTLGQKNLCVVCLFKKTTSFKNVNKLKRKLQRYKNSIKIIWGQKQVFAEMFFNLSLQQKIISQNIQLPQID